jgi:hypothetical protein
MIALIAGRLALPAVLLYALAPAALLFIGSPDGGSTTVKAGSGSAAISR